jgi:hypothetical protein
MKDNNVKEQLEATGLHAILRLVSTGQQFTLPFTKGERAKKVQLTLGHYNLEGDLILVDVDNGRGRPNLALQLNFGPTKGEVVQAAVTDERLENENANLRAEVDRLTEALDLAKAKLNDIAKTEPIKVAEAQDAGAKVTTPESTKTPPELKSTDE